MMGFEVNRKNDLNPIIYGPVCLLEYELNINVTYLSMETQYPAFGISWIEYTLNV